jgi:hypothetical protein
MSALWGDRALEGQGGCPSDIAELKGERDKASESVERLNAALSIHTAMHRCAVPELLMSSAP